MYATGAFFGTNVDFDPGAGTANLSSVGNINMFIAQDDASGNYLWANRIGSAIAGNGLAPDGSGYVLATGYFQGSDTDFDPGAGTANRSSGFGNRDAFALRLSSAGAYSLAVTWSNSGSQPSSMECRAIARDVSGNVYATGSFDGGNAEIPPGPAPAYLSSAGGEDIFIAKY